MEIADKIVLVAGGSAGIGLGCARAFARRGARVVVLVARGQARLEEAAGALRAAYPRTQVLTLSADCRDADAVRRLGVEVRARVGAPDLLCHSAGAGRLLSIEEETLENVRLHLESTFLGAFNLVREFLSDMRGQGRGHLVFAGGSPLIHIPFFATGYVASRSALWGLAQALREDLRGLPVGVTYCEPGGIRQGSAYFDDNPGSWERLPFARFRKLSALLYFDIDEVGRGIAEAVERDAALYSPPSVRALTLCGRSPLLRGALGWLLRMSALPPALGGAPRGLRALPDDRRVA